MDSASKTAQKPKRGRPSKIVSSIVLAERQQAANGRERKRMYELTRCFNELKKALPMKDQIQSKKEILVQVHKNIFYISLISLGKNRPCAICHHARLQL